ncbi:MAG TPA: hypothetical protein VL294_11605 [Pseudolysinimonas sp.]|nr:hypothetical protein [Pseudolysinimonas sp.]
MADATEADGAGEADAAEGAETQPERRPRHRRRVTTDVAPHVDPTPASEPARHRADENDDRLRAEKPPHY